MKIQLQSLHIVNCGPLDDVCIQFNTNGDSPVTVLAGANGSGKTTVLKLIVALCRTLPANTYYHVPGEHPQAVLQNTEYAQLDLQVGSSPVSIYSGWSPTGEVLAENRLGNVKVGSAQEQQSNGEVIQYISTLIKGQEGKPLNFSASSIDAWNAEEVCPSLLYFPFIRQLIPSQGEQILREQVKYEWIYRYEMLNSFRGSLDSYLIWLDYAEPEAYAKVIDFLDSLDFDGKKFGVLRKELRAIVTTRDGHTHSVAELSSGEQNILIILSELRRRLLPYSIVLIDEIENSLHLAFQHQLGQGLKRLQEKIPFQLIVTTHSSEFVDIFGPSSVRILTEF